MNEASKLFSGIGLTLLMHLAYVVMSVLVGIAGTRFNFDVVIALANWLFFGLLGIGIVQFLYVLPVMVFLTKRRRWTLTKGIGIGALLTILLNAGCFLYFWLPAT